MREGSEMLRLRLLPYTLAVVAAATTLGACASYSKTFLEQHEGRWAVMSRTFSFEEILFSYEVRDKCNEIALELNLMPKIQVDVSFLCVKIPNKKVKK